MEAVRRHTNMLEKDIQREICEWLNNNGFFFWRQNNIPVYSEGKFRAMPKYSSKGAPDIIILYDHKFIGLEVKVPDFWKFTDDQKRFKEKITENGGFYYIVTSLTEAVDIMTFFIKEKRKEGFALP